MDSLSVRVYHYYDNTRGKSIVTERFIVILGFRTFSPWLLDCVVSAVEQRCGNSLYVVREPIKKTWNPCAKCNKPGTEGNDSMISLACGTHSNLKFIKAEKKTVLDQGS